MVSLGILAINDFVRLNALPLYLPRILRSLFLTIPHGSLLRRARLPEHVCPLSWCTLAAARRFCSILSTTPAKSYPKVAQISFFATLHPSPMALSLMRYRGTVDVLARACARVHIQRFFPREVRIMSEGAIFDSTAAGVVPHSCMLSRPL